jgi:hypothetical protein
VVLTTIIYKISSGDTINNTYIQNNYLNFNNINDINKLQEIIHYCDGLEGKCDNILEIIDKLLNKPRN